MVGDIKQSIYRFRGAEPAIFADYRRTFPGLSEGSDTEEASIFMSNNFRCDRPVIDCTNRIFAYLFGHCGQSIGYVPEDDLVYGKHIADGVEQPPVTIALCPPDKGCGDEADDDLSPEYRYIADEIAHLLHKGKLDDGSPLKAADIAILMRAKTGADQLTLALAEAGNPL